jgi:hypothetical protein
MGSILVAIPGVPSGLVFICFSIASMLGAIPVTSNADKQAEFETWDDLEKAKP